MEENEKLKLNRANLSLLIKWKKGKGNPLSKEDVISAILKMKTKEERYFLSGSFYKGNWCGNGEPVYKVCAKYNRIEISDVTIEKNNREVKSLFR